LLQPWKINRCELFLYLSMNCSAALSQRFIYLHYLLGAVKDIKTMRVWVVHMQSKKAYILGGVFLLLLIGFSSEVSAYYQPYQQSSWSSVSYGGYDALSMRNQYGRYQIPSGTGYVFSPGYYTGPRYFPSFTRNYGAAGYGPYGGYSSRNRVYPYQYVPRWT